MAVETISYHALAKGLELSEIKFSNSNPQIEGIIIKADCNNGISITFTLNDIDSLQKAILITNKLLNVYLDQLAFEFDIPIEEHYFSECSFPINEKGITGISIAEYLSLHETVEWDFKPCKKSVDGAILKLEQATQSNLFLSLYRSSIRQKDPLTRFMLLYNLLLLLNEDSQKKVDEAIILAEPSVPQSISPKNQKYMETIYTRLRNEIAHNRNNVIPENTIKEIEDNVSAFPKVVKAGILEKI